MAPPSATTTGLIFGATSLASTSYTVNLTTAPFTLNSMTFNNNSGSTVTLAGTGSYNFDGTAPAITISGSGTDIISNAVNFNTITTIGGAGTGTLTISGAISTPSASATPGALVVNLPGTVVLAGGGTFNDGTTASTGGYVNVVRGTLKLTAGTYTTNYAGTANSLAGLQVDSLSTSGTTPSVFAMSGGATLTSPVIFIGRLAGSYANATLDGFGTTLTSLGQFTVGSRANVTANLTITNGAVATGPSMANGLTAGVNATINVNGVDANGNRSSYISTGAAYYAEAGTATLNVTAGGLATTSTNVFLGANDLAAVGNINISGTSGNASPIPSTYTVSGSLVVGGNAGTLTPGTGPGVGNVTVSGGGVLSVGATAFVNYDTGGAAGATSNITVTGAGSSFNVTSQFQMRNATSTLSVLSGATATFGSYLYVALSAGSTGSVLVSGTGTTGTGATLMTPIAFLGGSGSAVGGTASLTVASGGTANLTTGLIVYAGGTATVNSGGILNIGTVADGVAGSSSSVVLNTGGSLNILGTASGSYSGIISGTAGTLTKSGTATQTLAGANTWTGPTSVSGGILLAANTGGSATGTGTVSISSGGTLAGTGFITGSVTVSSAGTLSPGTGDATSPGVLTLSGTTTLASNATARFLLDGTPAGSTAGMHSQIVLGTAGTIALGGSILSVSPTSTGTYVPAAADSIIIIKGTGAATQVSGTFLNSPNGSQVAVGTYGGNPYGANIHYTASSVFLDTFVPVPEPTGLLVVVGMAGLLAASARRRFAV